MASTHTHAPEGHDAHHVTPLGTYFTIYGALLVLTVLTVAVSYMGLPSTLSIIVAMIVASVKATLVVLWFMHLKYDTKFNVLVFLSAIWFIALFFIFTMFDLSSRNDVLAMTGNYVLRTDRAAGTKSAVGDEDWLMHRTMRGNVLQNPADLWGSKRTADAARIAAEQAAKAPAPAAHHGGEGHGAEGAAAPAEGAAAPAEGAAAPAEGAAPAAAPAEGAPPAAPPAEGAAPEAAKPAAEGQH